MKRKIKSNVELDYYKSLESLLKVSFDFQEAARLQRECSVQPTWSSPSAIVSRSSHQSSNFGGNSETSCSSSRESSLGPISLNAARPSVGLYGGLRQLVIERNRGTSSQIPSSSNNGFGFTLRHFIVYPPEVSLASFYESKQFSSS